MIPGWTVSRVIPPETLMGLITGQYKLYGGVIRWAAGTSNAGQIVKHLIPLNTIPGLGFIPGIVANFQLEQLKGMTQFNTYQLMQLSQQVSSLSQSTQQILQLTTGTAVFSGLGLAVSCIGFMAINNKLNNLDDKLREIQKDMQAIKSFLESTERAKLCASLNALQKIDARTAPEHRHTILHTSRHTLAEINMRYRELLSNADTMETAMAYEEYFSLTALAQARCTAELGMLHVAYEEIQEMNSFWQNEAHRIAKNILVGKYPERFLATDFVDDVSVVELVQWLDFVYEEKKGFEWIDELRSEIKESWYSKGWFSGKGSGLNKNTGIGLEKEQKMLIPSLRKLMARSTVFEGYVAQYELLETQKLKPSEFLQKLSSLPESAPVEDYIILEPVKAA